MDVLTDDLLRAILERVEQMRQDRGLGFSLDYVFTCRRWLELDSPLSLGAPLATESIIDRPTDIHASEALRSPQPDGTGDGLQAEASVAESSEAAPGNDQPRFPPGHPHVPTDRLFQTRTSVTVREGVLLGEEELLRQLQSMTNVTSLTLRKQSVAYISDAFFEGIAKQFTNLQALDIPVGSVARSGSITASGLQALAGSQHGTIPDTGADAAMDVAADVAADVVATAEPPAPVALPLTKLKLLGCESIRSVDIPPLGRSFHGLQELELALNCAPGAGATEGQPAQSNPGHSLPLLMHSFRSLRILFLRAHGQFSLPASIGSLTALQRLTVKAPKLASVPAELGSLPSLASLHIFSMVLDLLPDSLSLLVSLKKLDLDCRSLTSLPDSIGALTCLQRVSLTAWSADTRLPESFFSLPNLRELQAGGELSRVADRIARLAPSLQTLSCRCFSNQDSEELVSSLSALTQLKALSLSGAPLRDGPIYANDRHAFPLRSLLFEHLTLLQELTLEKLEGVSSLPSSLGSLRCLRTLSLSICPGLVTLPDALGNLTSLTDLTLTHCRSLCSLPLSLAALPSLTRVLISFCHSLTALPYFAGAFPALRDLRLYQWGGSSLWALSLWATPTVFPFSRPSVDSLTGGGTEAARGKGTGTDAGAGTGTGTVAGAGAEVSAGSGPVSTRNVPLQHQSQGLATASVFPKLETLVVTSHELRRLPSEIGSCLALRELVLHCDRLAALPASLCQLSGLRELKVSAGIAAFPKNLGSLKGLEKLVVEKKGCPRIQLLPHTLPDLASLKVLTISSCPLVELPANFGALSNLEELRLGIQSGKQSENGMDSSTYRAGNAARAPGSAALGFLHSMGAALQGRDSRSGEEISPVQGGMRLARLPGSLCELPKLRVLELSGLEKVSSLPENLGSLKMLQVLSISHCRRLKHLPSTLGSLHFLRTLKVMFCPGLKELPEDLRGLGSLRSLELDGLPLLATLPRSLAHATSLSSISLGGLDRLASFSPLEEMKGLVELNIRPWASQMAVPEDILDLPLLSGPSRAALRRVPIEKTIVDHELHERFPCQTVLAVPF